MTIDISGKLRNAPYSTERARAPGWQYCVKAIDALHYDHPANHDGETAFYVTFTFMNGGPATIGYGCDPAREYYRSHVGSPIDVFRVLRDCYDELTADGLFHEAVFRYRKHDGWAVATFYDEAKYRWDLWRERRGELEDLRREWFESEAHPEGFEFVETSRLEILIDQQYGGYELVPLLVGWARKDVWMMTSGFSNPPDPRESDDPDDPGSGIELLFRCSRASVEEADTLMKSPEHQAVTQMAEAFYCGCWRSRRATIGAWPIRSLCVATSCSRATTSTRRSRCSCAAIGIITGGPALTGSTPMCSAGIAVLGLHGSSTRRKSESRVPVRPGRSWSPAVTDRQCA